MNYQSSLDTPTINGIQKKKNRKQDVEKCTEGLEYDVRCWKMRKSESTRATRTEHPAMTRAGWWILLYIPSYSEKWFDSIPQASLSPSSSQFPQVHEHL